MNPVSPVALSAYLGRSDRFDHAIAEFAARYGDQTDADHAAMTQASRDGLVETPPHARATCR